MDRVLTLQEPITDKVVHADAGDLANVNLHAVWIPK
jgi:hypothetical protein